MKFEYIPENDFEKTLVEHFQEELENRRSTLNTEERIFVLEEMLMKNQTAVVMENMILKTLAKIGIKTYYPLILAYYNTYIFR